ncbi:MAG: hypothetical protein GEV12_17795 [Micromonosporaceae bacterium]|nr:hypothetical protein [Micromonosporaceae bacterium]
MEDLVETVTAGHATAVKIVLASVLLALGVYQAMLMAVGYGKVRPPFLTPASAAAAHRAIGDAIVVLVVVVGAACLGYYGIEDSVQDGAPGPDGRVTLHVVASFALIGVLALKLTVLHLWRRAERLLPVLGLGVLSLLFITWLSSAGAFLVGAG